ncbi:CHAT domain-containing protein [Streptomyces sp. NPDC001407]|uniref:CHAT domain-containing protein n=1 Tax=Streptomyces sp. NPDC001407 TaxID=3364573 RepID=UPI003677160B
MLSPEAVDGMNLPAAGPAFLSGCGTAKGAAALADESLRVAAALPPAGYRDVIGTLWPVRDAAASAIARTFYREQIPKGKAQAQAPAPRTPSTPLSARPAPPPPAGPNCGPPTSTSARDLPFTRHRIRNFPIVLSSCSRDGG